jgi:2-methylcitrate dehydratase PrpD
MSIIEDLTRNILETRFESFDRETVEQAKNRVLDVVGCLIGGAYDPAAKMMVDLVKGWGGVEESTILVHGGKAPAHNAAMANSIMARSLDFDPVEPYVEGVRTPGHVSGTTVPVALAVAEQRGASGQELITALILGDDIASRLVAASGFAFAQGWDNSGTVNTFGAIAIAGRLKGLDERQIRNAFGIALNQMAGSLQNFYDGTHCFKLPIAFAARAGIFSAELASQGFTGLKDPLLSRFGYFALYCRTPNPEILTRGLGKKFYADCTFKPYPACRSTHSSIDGTLQLVQTHDIRPEDIDEITIKVTPATLDMFVSQPFEIGEVPQANAALSLRYTVASTLLRKSVRMEHFTEEFIRDPGVLNLIPKIKLAATIPPERPLAAAVEVKMKDGREFSARVDIPRGDTVDNPLTREELREKFRTNVGFSGAVARENAEKALSLIERLEEVGDIAELISEITRPT